jgi:hypothetical protein
MWPLFADTAETLVAAVELLRQPGQPSLVSEYGADFRGPAETLASDPDAVAFHAGLWAPLLAGTAGTGMSWWWDNVVDPEDLYFHLAAVSAFVDGLAFDEQGFAVARPAATAPGRALLAYALVGPETTLVWLRNAQNTWITPDATTVEGATLALPALAPGSWRARWFDPWAGVFLAEEPVAVGSGGAVLAVPAFARDVALRLERTAGLP